MSDKKKILVAVGSPRKNGNTALLVKKAVEGIESAGGVSEILNLHELNIKPCTACDWCRDNRGKFCVLNDDMKDIYPKLLEAYGLIIATPIYWFTVSAQTKVFMDRWYGFVDAGGYMFKEMPMGLMMVYGDSDPLKSGAINALRTFQDAFRYLGVPLIGTVYGSAHEAGEIASDSEVLDKAFALGNSIAQS